MTKEVLDIPVDRKLEVTPEEAEQLRQKRFITAYDALCKEYGYQIGIGNIQLTVVKSEQP